MNAWMVRAGDDNALIDFFKEVGVVAIGWKQLPDTTYLAERNQYKEAYTAAYPSHSGGRMAVNSGQIYRFEKIMNEGDYILTFDKIKREYLVGKCASKAYFDTSLNEDYPRIRRVTWIGSFSRNTLSSTAQNSFGSVLTVFSVSEYIPEIEACVNGKRVEQTPLAIEPEETVSLYEDIKTKADEKIADIANQLDPYDFQYLVGAIFRAMGFKTIEKDPGRDRGIDIIAFKDEFGFEKPRIKVQVKHRTSAAGGPDVRNFIGTLDEGESGVFISTGGYKGDALKEAERFSVKIALYTLDDVIDLLLKHYDRIEPEYRNLVPLAQVWVPLK